MLVKARYREKTGADIFRREKERKGVAGKANRKNEQAPQRLEEFVERWRGGHRKRCWLCCRCDWGVECDGTERERASDGESGETFTEHSYFPFRHTGLTFIRPMSFFQVPVTFPVHGGAAAHLKSLSWFPVLDRKQGSFHA